jgi:hypothetical protein
VTSAFRDFAWIFTRDHALNVRFDGAQPRLTDIQADPGYERDLAAEHPELVQELFARIVADAGGDLPTYARPTTFADGSRPPVG